MSPTIEQLEPRLCRSAFDLIGLPAEQRESPFRGAGLNVAVIDSGADLSQNYVLGAVNFLDPGASAADGYGHGAFIAAEIHQVAPAAGVYALKVLDDQGTGGLAATEKALQWVIDHYAQDNIVAVNYSIAYAHDDPTIDREFETLARDGVTVCVAAGNSQASAPNTLNAAANCPDVISVGATWSNYLVDVVFDGATDFQAQPDKIAAYSQRSAALAVLAPGDVHIDGQPKDWTGTSMATALVTGGAVLVHEALASQGRPAGEAQILAVIEATGKPIFDGASPLDNVEHTGETFARLDLAAAIASIVPPAPAPPAAPPKKAAPAEPTNTTFIASLYEHVLGRAPDAQGLAYWSALLAGGASRADVAARVWQSEEHAHQVHAAESAEQLYESLLGRPADAAGLAYFAGRPEDFVAETILSSPEFFNESV